MIAASCIYYSPFKKINTIILYKIRYRARVDINIVEKSHKNYVTKHIYTYKNNYISWYTIDEIR